LLQCKVVVIKGSFKTEMQKVHVSFIIVCPSIHPSICRHGSTELLLDGFLWNVLFY